MKKLSEKKLKEVLDLHKKWLKKLERETKSQLTNNNL